MGSDNDSEKSFDINDPNLTPDDISQYQSRQIGALLDYNQQIMIVCRHQAENWQILAQAYTRCAQMAADIAESCAVMSRMTVDRAGEILETEFGLVETTNYDDYDPEDDDDD